MAVAARRPINVQAVVIGLILLAVLGFVVYWFGFRGDEAPPQAVEGVVFPRCPATPVCFNASGSTLEFQPPSPNVSALPGGSANVTQIGASFVVGVQNLPEEASFEVTFAKDPTVFIQDAPASFQLLAESVNLGIGDLADQVAFMVKVDKTGITNQELGDNVITLEVSKQWFDDQRNKDRVILFAKFDDGGNPVLPAIDVTNSCVAAEAGTMACTATFSGSQGGLSGFSEFSGCAATAYPGC